LKHLEKTNLFCAETTLGPWSVLIISDLTTVDEIIINPDRRFNPNLKKYSREKVSPLQSALEYFKKYISRTKASIPPLDLSSFTDSERKVYKTLCSLPSGKTISYGELALKAGFPRAARFVGSTMRKNRFAVIIPCHRVLPASGLTGRYSAGSGEEVKQWLLDFERSTI